MKGFYELRPSIPNTAKTCSWDVNKVLHMLETWGPSEALTLKELTLKVVMLLALLSGQRCQTLHCLDTVNMKLTDKVCVFFITDLLKHSRKGVHQAPIEFKSYVHNENLCIVKCLKAYIDRTATIRGEETKLLISIQKPHKHVSKDTIARWIKKVLEMAGIDPSVYTAHSTRAASTSYASNIGLSVTTILGAAGWSNESTFAKYYKKALKQNFGQSIIENYFKLK